MTPVDEPEVTVVVTTLVAVVLAVQAVHDVHDGEADQDPLVQPDHVLGGHAPVPHHFVHGPLVQAPVLSEAQGPYPFPGPPCPNGPYPEPADHAPADPHDPENGPGAPVVCVFQLLNAASHAELVVHCVGHAEPPDVTLNVASGLAVTDEPVLAQSCAIVWYEPSLSESLHDELLMQELMEAIVLPLQ